MLKQCLLFCLVLFCLISARGEEEENYFDFTQSFHLDIDAFSGTPDYRVLLANATAEYPVTPGDVFQLSYLGSEGSVSFEIITAADFSLNLAVFGTINAEGMTYPALRDAIESRIRKAYSGSNPQLILQTTGIFQIALKGEVKSAQNVTCWGLSRAGDILKDRTTMNSSIRDITIISPAGRETQYDLFAYIRSGIKEQNPLLQPGDTVIIRKVKRQVRLTGKINRPGTYQLLDGEQLSRLCFYYGDGFTIESNPAQIRIIRTDTEKPGETFYIDASSEEFENFELQHLDAIDIPGKKEQLPVIYFEGAMETAGRDTVFPYTFVPGEKLSTAVRRIFNKFTAQSALAQAYLVREASQEIIPVNLELLMHSYQPEMDLLLAPYDRIMIPFKQFFVSVSGAVFLPGQYPYVPDQDYRYYLNQAGGIDPAKNSGQQVIIKDKAGRQYTSDRIIQPEDSLFADYNNPLYHIERWTPVIELVLSLTALVIGILQLAK